MHAPRWMLTSHLYYQHLICTLCVRNQTICTMRQTKTQISLFENCDSWSTPFVFAIRDGRIPQFHSFVEIDQAFRHHQLELNSMVNNRYGHECQIVGFLTLKARLILSNRSLYMYRHVVSWRQGRGVNNPRTTPPSYLGKLARTSNRLWKHFGYSWTLLAQDQ